jgi:hypothetical protein
LISILLDQGLHQYTPGLRFLSFPPLIALSAPLNVYPVQFLPRSILTPLNALVFPVQPGRRPFNWGLWFLFNCGVLCLLKRSVNAAPRCPVGRHDRTGVESLPNGIRSPFHRGESYSTGAPCSKPNAPFFTFNC